MPLLRHIGRSDVRAEQPYFVITFYCPGCKLEHPYRVVAPGHTESEVRAIFPNGCWDWNGSEDKPTFRPSLLCNEHSPEHRCHLHVTDGKIEYCPDCHHELRGQTVPMVPIDMDEPEFG